MLLPFTADISKSSQARCSASRVQLHRSLCVLQSESTLKLFRIPVKLFCMAEVPRGNLQASYLTAPLKRLACICVFHANAVAAAFCCQSHCQHDEGKQYEKPCAERCKARPDIRCITQSLAQKKSSRHLLHCIKISCTAVDTEASRCKIDRCTIAIAD